jgi:hypothetical protein
MRVRKTLAAAAAVLAGAAVSVGASASAAPAPAPAATTVVTLPITHYSHMLVDPAHQHLFITSGYDSSSILVTDYAGQPVTTIPDEAGATGLALSADGSTVYAALANGDAISAISTSSLSETARYPTGTGTDPTYVACSGGRIWFGYGAAAQGGIGSIDTSTSPATVTLNAAPGSWYYAPMVTAAPGGELVAGEPSQSPVELASYDVSSGNAAVLAPERSFPEDANLLSMQIAPDGGDVVVAGGGPGYQEVFKVTDLSAAGTYPTTWLADSVSIAANGTVAAGTCCGYSANGTETNEIFMFAAGSTTPENTISFGDNWLSQDGAALAPDGSKLFAVTTGDGITGTPQLNVVANPEQPASGHHRR